MVVGAELQAEVEIVEFTEIELELMAKYRLTAEQIGFRREVRANFGRGRRKSLPRTRRAASGRRVSACLT